MTEYSKKEFYDEVIAPLVREVTEFCKEKGVPFYMTFAVENNSKKTEYVTEYMFYNTNKKEIVEFTKKKAFDSGILKTVRKILVYCENESLPLFMTFVLKNEKDRTEYFTEMLSAASEKRLLKRDILAKHALVMAGFDLKLPEDIFDVDLQEMEKSRITAADNAGSPLYCDLMRMHKYVMEGYNPVPPESILPEKNYIQI